MKGTKLLFIVIKAIIITPEQRVYYSIDGTCPKKRDSDEPSSSSMRYGGPFWINTLEKVTVRTVSYLPSYFPGNSNEISAEYDVQDQPGGLLEELPEVISQQSLSPRVESNSSSMRLVVLSSYILRISTTLLSQVKALSIISSLQLF